MSLDWLPKGSRPAAQLLMALCSVVGAVWLAYQAVDAKAAEAAKNAVAPVEMRFSGHMESQRLYEEDEREVLKEIRQDLKGLRRTVAETREDVAFVRGRLERGE